MLLNSSLPFLETAPKPIAAMCMIVWLVALSFFNIFYIYEHHLKLTKYIVRRAGMENTFVQALILCLINSTPKIILMIILDKPVSLEEFASTISGSTQLSMTITFAIVLLSTKVNCFVHHTSFYKDILFLEASHLLLLLLFSNAPHFLAVPFMALVIFFVFLFNTMLLPVYIAPPVNNDTISTSSTIPTPVLDSILYPFRVVFSAILLDPSSLTSSGDSKKTSYANIFSPLINLLITVIYFRIKLRSSELLAMSLCSFILGLILYMLAKKKIFIEVLYLYSFVVSAVFFSIIMGSFVSLTGHLSRITGLGTQFLSGTFLALQANLTEIIVCSDYGRNGSATVAICSVLYTHIYNSLFAFPILKLFSSGNLEKAHAGNAARVPFVYFSYVFILAEIKVIFVNYLLRHHKLTKDLGYTLLVIYTLFMVGFSIEGKSHLCK